MSPLESVGTASIGKSVQIRGEVKGSEDLLVDGVVEGTITLTESRLTIGPNAHVQANVSARDVVILGSLKGDVHAAGRVELRAGSNIVGDIQAARLSIEENALFSGKVDLLQGVNGSIPDRGASVSAVSQPKGGVLFGASS